ncbi:MAG: hypothetical protein Q8P56_00455, partial [Candidatus Uhrbacteria bacterium]|nr:hypothetical protein [Candidatus Uhrbacteria bacterium]
IASELGVHFEDKKFLAGELSSLGNTGISTLGGMAGYILGIGLLMGSLMAAQQLSSVGGSMAGGAISGFKDYMQGKRGPFNPVRYLREGIGGVMARREERRKERVKERVERWDRSLGIAQQIPRELVRGAGKAALMTQPGQALMRLYERDSTQVGLDTAVRFGTLGVGGWGRVHKARNEARRSDLEHQIQDMEPKAGDHRGQAEQLDRTADEHMKNAMAARSRGDITTETSERAAAQSARDLARDQKRAAAGYENRIQWAKTQLGANKAREMAWSGLKTAALISHPLVGVTLGARMTDDMGKRGKESVELAESAQADDVRSRAQKFKDMSTDDLHAKYASTASNRDKMAINQVLIEKGEIEPNDVENIMQRQKGLGADGLTMKQLNRAVAQKYPTMNWGLDPTRMGLTRADQLAEAQRRVIPLFKDGTIKGEEITAEKLAQNNPDFNGAVFEALSDPRNTKERKDFMTGLQSIKGQRGTDARESVANIVRDEALRNRDANGEFLPAGRELLHIFFEAGGKMDNLLTSLDAAAGVFTNANDQRAFDQIAGNTDLNQHVLHALPEQLFDDEANNERPIIQGLIRNTTPAMLRRAREAPEGKSEEAADQLQRRFGNLANYSNIIDRDVNTAQQQHVEAQTVHQNITNNINTIFNEQTRIQQELATGRTEVVARNRAHVDALRNHGVVQANARRIMANPASSDIDRMQANQMLQAANAGLAEAANALTAANNTVTRLTTEEVAATQAVNDVRAPGGLYDQLNNATDDLQRADDALNNEQADRAAYQNLNPDAARTVGYLRPYMQYGVLGQQGAVPAAPPPPPTP